MTSVKMSFLFCHQILEEKRMLFKVVPKLVGIEATLLKI